LFKEIFLSLIRNTGCLSSLLKNHFVGESAAKRIRSRSQIADISAETSRIGDAELMSFDRSQPE